MKKVYLYIMVLLLLSSCYRKPLHDECLCDDSLSIPIDIDWEASSVVPQNVTVLFYHASDGTLAYEHTYEHNSKEIQDYAFLAKGEYTAVVFNELRGQIDYLTCVGYENLSTLKFESVDENEPLRSRAVTRSYIKQSGDLAVATVPGIVVTEDMIIEAASVPHNHSHDGYETKSLSATTKATVESLMDVVPLKKNTTIKIKAHVKNIFFARMPSLVDLINLSDGYYVEGDRNSSSTSTLQFTMNNRTYDPGFYYDGTISTTVTSFGTLGERTTTSGHSASTPITLDILFKQVDTEQTETTLVMDVTDKVTLNEQSDGSVVMEIDVEFPEALPEVKPEESEGGSGFGSSVEDWDDVVNVPIS